MAIKFVLSDITKLRVDAIVNAANETLLGGGGVDGAIHQSAGPKLLEYCKTLGGAKTTEAKITPGFDLSCKYIIHAVGPVYKDGLHNESEELYNTYKNALHLAALNKVNSIAFPLISTGAYGFPMQQAIDIACQAINDFLETNELDVSLVFYDRKTFDNLSLDKYEEVLKFIGQNYVHEYKIDSERKIRNVAKKDFSQFDFLMDISTTLNDVDETFADKMNKWMIAKNIPSNELWKLANIDRKLFSKVFNGSRPSKKTAILLTLALALNIDDSLDLLSRAGYTLSNALKDDIVVRWHIENNIHSVYEVCQTQLKLGLPTLF
ncbi:MAG: macro domain-containing protein [Acholeplasma sp.]|nr:macro domain-containing protein [Acholeplasma sp.]